MKRAIHNTKKKIAATMQLLQQCNSPWLLEQNAKAQKKLRKLQQQAKGNQLNFQL